MWLGLALTGVLKTSPGIISGSFCSAGSDGRWVKLIEMLFGWFKPDVPTTCVPFAGVAALQKATLPPSAVRQLRAQEPSLHRLYPRP